MISLLLGICIFGSAQKNIEMLDFSQGSQNWIVHGDDIWKHSNKATIGEASEQLSYLISTKKFENFELTLEFKPDANINSGVFVRCTSDKMSPDECLEINIMDLHANPDFRTGAIVKKQKPKVSVETVDKWNTYRIKCKNSSVKVWVNGIQTAKYKDRASVNGLIGLQANGTGTIEFKNIQVKQL